MKKSYLAFVFSACLLATACRNTPTETAQTTTATSDTAASAAPPTPDWAKNATIYEVNTRQFSPEGNFKAVEEQLPRLKEMGVDILWSCLFTPSARKTRKAPSAAPMPWPTTWPSTLPTVRSPIQSPGQTRTRAGPARYSGLGAQSYWLGPRLGGAAPRLVYAGEGKNDCANRP